jgi:hypothetical protein
MYAAVHLMHSNGAINQPIDKDGRTVLYVALRRFEPSYQVENLILLGARLNQLDNYGISAKDYAIGIESHNYGSAVRRLFMRYTRRHNNCRSVAYCLYGCLRLRRICKDVGSLIAQAIWRTRNEKAWSL